MLHYLTLLAQSRILPNFWVSPAYLERAGAQEYESGDLIWLEADGVPLFPPLSFSGKIAPMEQWPVPYCWSDFEGFTADTEHKELLDYEYLYAPANFKSMVGGKWATFRKNCRKYPTRNPGSTYNRDTEPTVDELVLLLQRWAAKFDEEDTIHDFPIILRYIENIEHQSNFGWKTLRSKYGELIGINIWDRNWKYINFRYCFCDQSIPFLSEYIRWLFYTDPVIVSQNRLVCDGGVLDRPELKSFKEKLNPYRVREVYTWGKEPGG